MFPAPCHRVRKPLSEKVALLLNHEGAVRVTEFKAMERIVGASISHHFRGPEAHLRPTLSRKTTLLLLSHWSLTEPSLHDTPTSVSSMTDSASCLRILHGILPKKKTKQISESILIYSKLVGTYTFYGLPGWIYLPTILGNHYHIPFLSTHPTWSRVYSLKRCWCYFLSSVRTFLILT